MSKWQRIPENKKLFSGHPKYDLGVTNHAEAGWLKDVCKLVSKGRNECKQLDLLEVYAYPNSKLTEVAQKCGLNARRFTKEHGDLSTHVGQVELLTQVILFRPKHVWLAPECGPWSSWNRFNSSRSVQSFVQVKNKQQASRVHLQLCNLIAKIQISEGRHVHLENPWTAQTWTQPELAEFLKLSLPARLDQCMFGLRHPETADALQKKTRVQTSSREMFTTLDQRTCDHEHAHTSIAGSCKVGSHRMQLSQFAGFYPKTFANAIVKGILKTKEGPVEKPIFHVDEITEPPSKRAKIEYMSEDQGQELPKSGVKVWTNPMHPVFKHVQACLPEQTVRAIKAGKGLDRFIQGDHGWSDEFPMRHTFVLHRNIRKIIDAGSENWTTLSKAQQHRKALPSHVMLCVFLARHGVRRTHEESIEDPEDSTRAADSAMQPLPEHVREEQTLAPTWTPMTATVSGPKFLELPDNEQGKIRKLHNNLGHPTAEKLSRHLAEANAPRSLVEGAKDYLCASCAERKGPQKTTPGHLKDPIEFNDKISIDGFEWSSKRGLQVYVLHIIDDATRFHLGTRTQRDSQLLTKAVKTMWMNWAGTPNTIAHDQGGEFMTDEWKQFLQENNIQSLLSAAPWQRGRIERHGGIIKEMLNRIDHEKPIDTLQQLDDALQQCFNAKNTMSVINGFRPEQAVLGRASKLPASLASDENLSAHLTNEGEDLASERFRQKLELRTAARAAFSRADNSDAIRRAVNQQSRGVMHNWACGQLCMYWDRRKSPGVALHRLYAKSLAPSSGSPI